MYKIKTIFIFSFVLVFSIHISYAGFSDFVGKRYTEEKKLGIDSSKSGSNVITSDLLSGGGNASVGMKMDCNNIDFNFDFGGFFKDIENELKRLMNDDGLKNILIINAILDLTSYGIAVQKCAEKLPKDIALGPVISKAIGDTKQCVGEELSDMVSMKSSVKGGTWLNPSGSCKYPPCIEPWVVGEKESKVNAQKSVSAGYCNYSKLQQLLGEDFMNCLGPTKEATLKYILDLLNWKLTFNFKQMFKLQEECKLSNEQKEYDLVSLYQKAKEEGEITLASWRLPTGKVFSIKDENITIELADDYLPESDREKVYNKVVENYGNTIKTILYNNASFKTFGDVDLLDEELTFLEERVGIYLDKVLLKENTIKSVMARCKINLSTISSDANKLKTDATDYLSEDLNKTLEFIKYKDLLNVLFYTTYNVCKDYILTYNSQLAEHINNLTEFINGKSYKVNTDLMKNELKKFEVAIKELNLFISNDLKEQYDNYIKTKDVLNVIGGNKLATTQINYSIDDIKNIINNGNN